MEHKHSSLTISRSDYDAVIFDLDGVVTKTARVHAAAWKRLFDEYLKKHASSRGEDLRPFDRNEDYRRYVDGKPRYDGVSSFLKSRGIDLPYGTPEDDPGKETVCGLGNRKNRLFHELLEQEGVEPYDSTIQLIQALKSKGFKAAIVSSSKNCAAVLKAAGIEDLFDTRVDGIDADKLNLEGKPAPDIFLEAANRLEVDPERAIVVEDAVAGVQAGRRGHFGCVIGVDRTNHVDRLKQEGAHIVVSDLSEIAVAEDGHQTMASSQGLPSALESMGEIERSAQSRRMFVFLDYDGTLTPIVENPQDAILSDQMRDTVRNLSTLCTVAVISGRDRTDVQDLVGIDSIIYAGSHGFDIASPEGELSEYQKGADFLPVLDLAEANLKKQLRQIAGAVVERKKYSIAVHYRKASEHHVHQIEEVVDQVRSEYPELRKSSGKKIFELQPNIDWNKGKAVLWLLEILEADAADALPLYIGDDTTDEDAFRALRDNGVGIIVTEASQDTAARYRLRNPGEVREFLTALASILKGGT
jgi:alpha,alpha-trehalase